jgi:uncharacterized membrane protein
MKYKTDKGVAGLSILLSVIVLLFLIGLIVMIFSLMGSGLRDATYTSTTTTKTNESVTFGATNTAQSLASSTLRNVVCVTTPVQVLNQTRAGANLGVTNVTLTSSCTLLNATALGSFIGNGTVYVSYTYTFDADNTATNVMNDTYTSVGSVTDWFDIFIVITAMVVLILLVVIIVTAIRGSGLVSEGGSAGANKVGTA